MLDREGTIETHANHADFFALLDEETRDLIARVEVPIGKDSEYKELVDRFSHLYGITVEKDVVVKAIRGLNLHQAEAVLLEAYWKTKSFDLYEIKSSSLKKKIALLLSSQ